MRDTNEQSWNLASGKQISELSALQMEKYMKGRIRTVHVTRWKELSGTKSITTTFLTSSVIYHDDVLEPISRMATPRNAPQRQSSLPLIILMKHIHRYPFHTTSPAISEVCVRTRYERPSPQASDYE
jgi:hypothetical protein